MRVLVGGEDRDRTICYFDWRPLEKWPYDYPSPMFGLPSWYSAEVPLRGPIIAGTAFSPYAPVGDYLPPNMEGVYGMPGFVSSAGQCVLGLEGRWQCLGSAEGLPFDDIRGYGVVQEDNVEWFMSADSVASRGLSPRDQVYSIPELVGDAAARPTWLSVRRDAAEGIWVGTNGYGVIHILRGEGLVTRYTTADGLPSDVVREVQGCGQLCAWVATDRGAAYWDGSAWTAYTTAEGLPSNDMLGISTSDYYDRGLVWAATTAGPALFQRGTASWQTFPDFPADVEVNGVLYGYFSTRGQGLARFVWGGVLHGEVMRFTAGDALPSDQVTALEMGPNGILVGTSAGAVEWDGASWTTITTAAVNDASSISIATDEGLWVWLEDGWQRVNDERVLLAAEGGWYATADEVCLWQGGASICPTTDEGSALAGIRALYADPASSIGIVVAVRARDEQWRYDARLGLFTPYGVDFMPGLVQDLVVQHNAWHYASSEGVYHAPCDDRGCTAYGDFRLSGSWPIDVRQVRLHEPSGRLWIATGQGAFFQEPFDPGYEQDWTYLAGLPVEDLTAVLPLPDGSAWLGTAAAGVLFFEPVGP